jgi:hypothetical protein
LGVHGLVGQGVGALVGLTGDVLEPDLVEALSQAPGLGVQRQQRRAVHLVGAAQLLDDQLGVAAHPDPARTKRPGPLQPGDDRPVLGDVVGRPADSLRHLGKHLSLELLLSGRRFGQGGDDHAVAGRAGVAAGAAVDLNHHLSGPIGQVSVRLGNLGGRRSRLGRGDNVRVAIGLARTLPAVLLEVDEMELASDDLQP